MSEQNLTTQLINLISPLVTPLGYEIVHLEVVTSHQKALRIFIDHLNPAESQGIGIGDCVTVTRALDEPLDLIPEVEKIFRGHYELEVSSPGVDRPLRNPKDFERFSGREVRIHVYRPLSGEELDNAAYQAKNPKQKNFIGVLKGFRNQRVLLDVSSSSLGKSAAGKKAKKKKSAAKNGSSESGDVSQDTKAAILSTNSADEVSIPLPLIAKANLEPKFEPLFAEDERE